MQQHGRTAEEIIRDLASQSHGVVTRSELLAAGVSTEAIRQRTKKGLLTPVHRGVYRVGHLSPSYEARCIAAVKAAGRGSLLCGRAAAHVWDLIKGSPPQPEVRSANDRRIAGVRVQRARRTEIQDATKHRGIPLTTIPRTLVDLASSLPEQALARACHQAGVRYRTTPAQVSAVLERTPNAAGCRKLKRILRGDTKVTLSRLESRFLELLNEQGMSLPETNKLVGGHRVDCRWPEQRLTVELDSYRYHQSRHAWEQDRLREREARARGDEFRRYTWGDVFDDSTLMLAELRELLIG